MWKSWLHLLCCDMNSRACVYRECNSCRGCHLSIVKEYDQETSSNWYQWQLDQKQHTKAGVDKVQTVKRIVKAQCKGTVKTLLEKLDTYFKQKPCKLVFNLTDISSGQQEPWKLHYGITKQSFTLTFLRLSMWVCKRSAVGSFWHFKSPDHVTHRHSVCQQAKYFVLQ